MMENLGPNVDIEVAIETCCKDSQTLIIAEQMAKKINNLQLLVHIIIDKQNDLERALNEINQISNMKEKVSLLGQYGSKLLKSDILRNEVLDMVFKIVAEIIENEKYENGKTEITFEDLCHIFRDNQNVHIQFLEYLVDDLGLRFPDNMNDFTRDRNLDNSEENNRSTHLHDMLFELYI